MSALRYSIKDLENFTQIKAHTIRIWEQRYGLLEPQRTETNIRYYSEDDLKKILNINLLYHSGMKISKIAQLSGAEIISKAKGLILETDLDRQKEVAAITLQILAFNKAKINELLAEALMEKGVENMYESVVLPVLRKLGQLWQVNTIRVIHEHYFSNIFREFILAQINAIHVTPNAHKKAVLFLHDNEEHEFGLLMFYYILKASGYECHYFGQKVPLAELKEAIDLLKPNLIVTSFIAKMSEKEFRKIEQELYRFAAFSHVVVSGYQLSNFPLEDPNALISMNTIDQLRTFLKERP